MIDFYGPGYEVAEQMGLRPRLLELRYPFSAFDYVDRDGWRTSSLEMPTDFDQEVVSLLRGELARTIRDEVRAPVRYHTSIEEVEQTESGLTERLTDGTQREVDLLVGAVGAHSRVREPVFGAERGFLRYLGHQVAAYLVTHNDLSPKVGVRYRMLTVSGTPRSPPTNVTIRAWCGPYPGWSATGSTARSKRGGGSRAPYAWSRSVRRV
jgi:2-polyprenyl-6-methoxyphenol hydroxylase-like FAD-dependent oxidoreductase